MNILECVTLLLGLCSAVPVAVHAMQETLECDDSQSTVSFILTNRNPAPVITGMGGSRPEATFSKGWDREEHERVLSGIECLCKQSPERLSQLLELLDSDDYCITAGREHWKDNLTVGRMCRVIVAECVCGPYQECVSDNELLFRQLHNPDFICKDVVGASFGEWVTSCVKDGKSAHEIQIEMCSMAAVACLENERLDPALRQLGSERFQKRRLALEESGTAFRPSSIWRLEMFWSVSPANGKRQ